MKEKRISLGNLKLVELLSGHKILIPSTGLSSLLTTRTPASKLAARLQDRPCVKHIMHAVI